MSVNKEVELLLENMVKKRGTGRTRRMLFEAARQVFLEGKSVVIVVASVEHQKEIFKQIQKYFNSDISDNIYICIRGNEHEKVKSFGTPPSVLYDHFCLEKDLITLMEKYTMFDQ